MTTDISHAAAALGRKGGSAKSKIKAAASRQNGAKGGHPGRHTVTAIEPGYDHPGPTIFLAEGVAAPAAVHAAKSAVLAGHTRVFVELLRRDGTTCYLNPDGSYDLTGKAWDS
jgi:hypothetical protein